MFTDNDLWTQDYLKQLDEGKIKLEHVKKFKSKKDNLNNIYDQIKKYSLNEKMHLNLLKYAKSINIDFASTTYTKKNIDFLFSIGVDFFKIASPDVTDLELIKHAVLKNIPVFISLGLTSISEIENIVNIIPNKYKKNIFFLHCISSYPASPSLINLNFINILRDLFGINVGYSDHTLGIGTSLASVVFGCKVIEKHFTLNRRMEGWDHCISVEPLEMKLLCEESKKIYDAIGRKSKKNSKTELLNKKKFRKSIVLNRNIKKGEILKREDFVFKRPGTGIGPDNIEYVLGRKYNKNINIDKILQWKDID
jgi:N-acetylneuraminate synthase